MKSLPEIIRFYIVGVINTLFGYGVFALLIFLKCTYPIAALIATVLGVLFNYQTTGRLVFTSKKASIFRFVIFYSLIYATNIVLFKTLKTLTSFNDYYLGLIITGFLSIMSYLANKFIVFTKEAHENN